MAYKLGLVHKSSGLSAAEQFMKPTFGRGIVQDFCALRPTFEKLFCGAKDLRWVQNSFMKLTTG